MRIAIMQPTYLPWMGYFNLVMHSDIFIFLDDVQFSRRSWQQRNRILLNGSETMLSIPISNKNKREQLIKDVTTDQTQNWADSHFKTLTHAYLKAPYGKKLVGDLKYYYLSSDVNLCDFNIALIEFISKILGYKGVFLRSSEIHVSGAKSEKLLNLCGEVGATTYLSAGGSKDYIERDGLFAKSGVEVQYQRFECAHYPQHGVSTFVPNLAIVDFLANVDHGENLGVILSGWEVNK